MKSLKTISIITIIVLSSCLEKRAISDLHSDSTFVNFQADLMIIREENQFLKLDSITSYQRIDSLYRHYNLTKEQDQEKLDFYQKEINRWKEFNETVMQRLEFLQRNQIQTTKF